MTRLKQAASVALVFTVYIMLFFFIVEVLFAIAHRTAMLQVVYDTFVTGCLLFAFITFMVREIYRFVDERDRVEELEREQLSKHPPENIDADREAPTKKAPEMPAFKQISKEEWVSGFYHEMAMIDASWNALESRLGAKFEEYDQDGLGVARGAMFITKSGKQFIIEHLLQAPTSGPHTSIHGLNVVPDASKCAFDTNDLEEILEATGFASSELTWLHRIDQVRKARGLETRRQRQSVPHSRNRVQSRCESPRCGSDSPWSQANVLGPTSF